MHVGIDDTTWQNGDAKQRFSFIDNWSANQSNYYSTSEALEQGKTFIKWFNFDQQRWRCPWRTFFSGTIEFLNHIINTVPETVTVKSQGLLLLSYSLLKAPVAVVKQSYIQLTITCWQFQGVSVEAVDPVFQAKMLDMLKQTGRWDTL